MMEQYKLSQNRMFGEQLKEFQENPKSMVFVSLAEIYRQQGLIQEALDVCNEGLEFHPSLSPALMMKAKCLFDLKKFGTCLETLQLLLHENPDNYRALKLRADVYILLNQKKQLMAALDNLIARYPHDAEAVRKLEELEEEEAPIQVPVRKISRAYSENAVGSLQDFQIQAGLRSITEANLPDYSGTMAIEERLEDHEEPSFATRTIAELYMRQGLNEKAIRVLKKMHEGTPDDLWVCESLKKLMPKQEIAAIIPSKFAAKSVTISKIRVLERLLASVQGV